ncbi:hypothetical protein ACSFC1_00690 [Pseudothermotoga sp. U03pept]|uniref:hypothetical protein n=1 Tax=Pseudothermotoga sp. U03pept TaxID=3447012 RepID=UPI003F0617A2
MKRNVIVIFISILTLLAQLVLAQNTWTTTNRKDPMTEKITWYALSPSVSPIEKMSFPYEKTQASIVVARQGKEEWVYISFNVRPNIVGGSIVDGYEVITTRIKWDNSQPVYAKFLTQFGSKLLLFENTMEIIQKILLHRKLIVELDWYGQGLVHFEFSLEGAANAITQIRRK